MTSTGERDGRTYHYDTDKEVWLWDDTGEEVPQLLKGLEPDVEGLMEEYVVKTVQQHMIDAGCGSKTTDWMRNGLKIGWLLDALVCITVDAKHQDSQDGPEDDDRDGCQG